MTTVTRPALLSAMAYMLQAAGVTVTELAQHMGHKLQAAPIVIEPPEHNADAITPRVAETLKHCDNPDGASIPELMAIMGLSIQAVSGYVVQLQRLGKVVLVKAPGVRAPRCFTDAVHAQRWVDSHAQAAEQARQEAMQQQAAQIAARQARDAQKEAERQAAQARREQAKAQARQDKAEKAAESQGLRAARKSPRPDQAITVSVPKPAAVTLRGDAVIPEGVKLQVDSTKRPTARWQAAELPDDPRWPRFSSTPLGVNPDTGRPWA